LKKWGLRLQNLLPLDDALGVVADKMSDIESPTERAAQAAALFGREGVAMVNMLGEGSGALSDMRDSARDAGAVIDEELIRNAEEAQTKIDAAARVIKAQLSVALADLVPIIVSGAEGLAAFVKNVVGAIEAVDRFLDPQSELEVATDNLVTAMGDEITQSQKLEIALGKSTNMSVDAARQKLKEAKSRHNNARAAIAEQQALNFANPEFQNVTDTIQRLQQEKANLESVVQRAEEQGKQLPGITADPESRAAELASIRNNLERARQEQERLLEVEQELIDHYERTGQNLDKLDTALANASDGMVSFGEDVVNPIERSERLSSSVSSASTATDDLIAGLEQTKPAIEALGLSVDETDNLFNSFESSMESAFMSMVDGTKSAEDAFKTMAASIIKELYRVLVVEQLVSSISGAVQGFFGGGSPTTSPRPRLAPRASGGTVQAGQPYMTGESGRELFVPKTDGRILSPAQTSSMGGGGDAVTVNQTINVSTGVQQTVRTEIKSLMPQIAEGAKSAVVDAKLRGGTYGRSF
jgi:predicted nuclease with TOPRIM domain